MLMNFEMALAYYQVEKYQVYRYAAGRIVPFWVNYLTGYCRLVGRVVNPAKMPYPVSQEQAAKFGHHLDGILRQGAIDSEARPDMPYIYFFQGREGYPCSALHDALRVIGLEGTALPTPAKEIETILAPERGFALPGCTMTPVELVRHVAIQYHAPGLSAASPQLRRFNRG